MRVMGEMDWMVEAQLIHENGERMTPGDKVLAAANRHPGSARFHEILAGLGELHDKKQQDYGRPTDPFANVRASIEWGVTSWIGAMIRATDKVRRLQTFAQKGTLANEGVEDSLRDLAVYAIISLVLYEEESKLAVLAGNSTPDNSGNVPGAADGLSTLQALAGISGK